MKKFTVGCGGRAGGCVFDGQEVEVLDAQSPQSSQSAQSAPERVRVAVETRPAAPRRLHPAPTCSIQIITIPQSHLPF